MCATEHRRATEAWVNSYRIVLLGWENPLTHNSLMVEMGHGLSWQVKDKHVRVKIKQTQTKYRRAITETHVQTKPLCTSAQLLKHVPVIFTSHFRHTFLWTRTCYPDELSSTPHIYMFNTRERVTHGKNANDVAGLWRGELLERTLCVCCLSWRQTGWVYHREDVQPWDGLHL